MRLTPGQVAAWRVRQHRLVDRAPRSALLEVVARLCGLHAQLLSSAELTLWARVQDLERGDVERALWEERTLVKTWAIRGTLHLLPAAELSLWQAALGTYAHYLKPAWLRAFGVTREELERLIAAVASALDGRLLTREELAAEVERRTGSRELADKVRESWGALLKPAAFRGHLCFAPNAGQNVRFTRPDRWVRTAEAVDPDAALLEIASRFLSAYGPATREHFARWWATTPAQAGKLLARLGEEAVEVDVNGRRGWMRASDAAEAAAIAPTESVRLLPAFDQYVVGAARDDEGVVAAPFRDRVYRAQGWLSPALLVDGRVEGVWRHERKGARVSVTVEPFRPVPKGVREATGVEAERLASFLGGELDLSWAS